MKISIINYQECCEEKMSNNRGYIKCTNHDKVCQIHNRQT